MPLPPRSTWWQQPRNWRLPAILAIAVSLKLALGLTGVAQFNADEAVVGLMARHILAGARPVFFYGQAYMGSLDAWLIAGGFALFGPQVWVIRLVQGALYLGTISVAYALARHLWRSEWLAGATALLLAVPPVFVTLYTTVTLGGYGETLFIGGLLLWGALHWAQPHRAWWGWLGLGVLGGLGFWGFPLIIVYLLPLGLYLLWVGGRRWGWLTARLAALGAGMVVGATPWWWHTLTQGWVTISEASGAAIATDWHPVFSIFKHLFYFALFGMTVITGVRPSWSATFLALPLIPYVLIIYTALLVFSMQRLGRTEAAQAAPTSGRWLLAGVALANVAGYVLTPFGADPSGRYFLPLATIFAFWLADLFNYLRLRRRPTRGPRRKWFGNVLALALVVFNFWGTVQSAATFPPGLTTQFDPVAQVDHRALPTLMAFLRAQGETRGYSNYWVEFPLAFMSNEELLFEARLPYHQDFRYTPRDNRYPPYADTVAASPRAAYITTHHEPLNERLRAGFTALGVTFQETQIGDYHVFYALSRKVVPEELGLGVFCCP